MLREGLYEFGPENMNLSIYTFKDGFLSALSYDLFIKVNDFKLCLEINGGNASGNKMDFEINADSLKVASLMLGERTDKAILTEKHQDEINSNIKGNRILNAERYPKITFISKNIIEDVNCLKVTGDLALLDKIKEIEFILKKDFEKPETKFYGSFDLYQSKFGIRPYTAMFGTLKIKDKIEVKCGLELPTQY